MTETRFKMTLTEEKNVLVVMSRVFPASGVAGSRCLNHILYLSVFYPVFLQVASFSGRFKWGLDVHPLLWTSVQQPSRRGVYLLAKDPGLMLPVSDWPRLSLVITSPLQP